MEVAPHRVQKDCKKSNCFSFENLIVFFFRRKKKSRQSYCIANGYRSATKNNTNLLNEKKCRRFALKPILQTRNYKQKIM